MDARCFRTNNAQFKKDTAKMAKRKDDGFNLEQFALKLTASQGLGREDARASHNWVQFGLKVIPFFRKCPTVSYMYGALDVGKFE